MTTVFYRNRTPVTQHGQGLQHDVKVAITIEELDLRRGGAEGATAWLVRQLAEHGHDVHIFSRNIHLDLPLGVRFREIKPRAITSAGKQWTFATQVARHLQHDNFDVSIACGRGFSEDIIWAQNGAHAAAVAGQVRSYYRTPTRRILRQLQPRFSPRAMVYELIERRRYAREPKPHVIAVSNMVSSDITRLYGLDPSQVFVMHNHVVIDYHRFNSDNMSALRDHARATLQLGKNTLVILCVAQNFRRKGVRPLIEAAARLTHQHQLRNFCVLIAGSTPKYTIPFRKLAKRLGCAQQIYFVGHRRQVEELYAAADVFCLPTFYDPCALTVSEALASGLPCITTRTNGACELIDQGVNGYIVEDPTNPDELTDCLKPLFNEDTRRQMRAAALDTVRSYDIQTDTTRLINFIVRVAKLKQRATVTGSVPMPSTAAS